MPRENGWATQGIEDVIIQVIDSDNSDSNSPSNWTFEDSRDVTASWSSTSSINITIGISTAVKEGIDLFKASATASWQTTIGTSPTRSNSYTHAINWSGTGVIPAPTKQQIMALTQQGELAKLTYDCRITLSFKDGRTLTFADAGEFNGVAFTGVHIIKMNTTGNGVDCSCESEMKLTIVMGGRSKCIET